METGQNRDRRQEGSYFPSRDDGASVRPPEPIQASETWLSHGQTRYPEPPGFLDEAAGGAPQAGADPTSARSALLSRRGQASPGKPRRPRRQVGFGGSLLKQVLIGLGVLSLMLMAVAAFLSVINDRSSDPPPPAPNAVAEPIAQPAVVNPSQVTEVTTAPVVATQEQGDGGDGESVPAAPPVTAPPDPLVAVAERVLPAVVTIETPTGQGSGIIYDPEGYIYTAAHVLDEADSVVVRLHSGFKVEGEIIGANAEYDVAVVKIDTDQPFGVAEVAGLSTVKVGQVAVAAGSPYGFENGVSSGIVSAVGRVPSLPSDSSLRDIPSVGMIQTSSAINFGDSGGALADSQGRVIGMNVAIVSAGGGNDGLGFAIPIEVVKKIGDLIIAGDDLQPGFVGITGMTPQLGHPGAEIVTVVEGAPADLAGLRAGDLIVAVDGLPVKSIEDLVAILRLLQVGTEVDLEIERDGDRMNFEVTLSSRDLFDEE